MTTILLRQICIITILFSFNLSAFFSHTVARDKVKIYKSLNKALKHPEKVRALDLRGQGLKVLPNDIAKFENLELLWLGPRLRNLWLYPKAWPYKIFWRQLPAGGYKHLQGRGKGKFYFHNYIDSLPDEFYKLKKLKFIDARYNDFADTTLIRKLKTLYPEIVVLSFSYGQWEEVEAEITKSKKCLDMYDFN
jgi:hypothetical protein